MEVKEEEVQNVDTIMKDPEDIPAQEGEPRTTYKSYKYVCATPRVEGVQFNQVPC